MSLFGHCDDCGLVDHLRYKPDVELGEQSRPSVCRRCFELREGVRVETSPIDPIDRRGLDPVYENTGDQS